MTDRETPILFIVNVSDIPNQIISKRFTILLYFSYIIGLVLPAISVILGDEMSLVGFSRMVRQLNLPVSGEVVQLAISVILGNEMDLSVGFSRMVRQLNLLVEGLIQPEISVILENEMSLVGFNRTIGRILAIRQSKKVELAS